MYNPSYRGTYFLFDEKLEEASVFHSIESLGCIKEHRIHPTPNIQVVFDYFVDNVTVPLIAIPY
jgi:hypothetical protein